MTPQLTNFKSIECPNCHITLPGIVVNKTYIITCRECLSLFRINWNRGNYTLTRVGQPQAESDE